MLHTNPDGRASAQLNDRHREVLDLMIAHKKRKEVARDLNISLRTVDQRLVAAKKILGTVGLPDTLRTYQALCGIYDKVTYSENQLHSRGPDGHSQPRNEDAAVFSLSDASALTPTPPWHDDRVLVPPMLEGQSATLKRLVYIVGAAVGILVAVLVCLSVATALDGLF